MIIANKNNYKIDFCELTISWRLVRKTGILNRSSKKEQDIQILPVLMPTGIDYRIPWHNLLNTLVMGDKYSETWGSSVMPLTILFDEKTGTYSAYYRIGFDMLPEDVYYIVLSLFALQDKKVKSRIDNISISISAPDGPASGCKEIIKCYSKDVIELNNLDDSGMSSFIGWLSRENNNWSLNMGILPEFAKNGKKTGGTAVVYI